MEYKGQELPALRTRAAGAADVDLAVRWMTQEWSIPASRMAPLKSLILDLFRLALIRGGCIDEYETSQARWIVKALGLSAFVKDAFVEEYLNAPGPYPSLSLLERALEGDLADFCNSNDIASANAGKAPALNQMTIYYGQLVKDPADPVSRRILPASHKMHREVHSGFRIKRLLQDEWTSSEPVFLFAGYKLLRRFAKDTPCPLGRPPLEAERSLVSLTAADAAQQLPGSTASFIFEYRSPRLALSDTQQRIVSAACSGQTDRDISASLDISPNTLKAAWRSVYDKFDKHLPGVAGHVQGESDSRGREKRRLVVAYIQDHPEELRPFAW